MISIYTTAFNVKTCRFNPREAFENFCAFADEVVCATLPDKDDSYSILTDLAAAFPNLKMILTSLTFDDPWLDGRLKNEALQATSGDLKLQMDLDERVCEWQKDSWLEFGEFLLTSEYQALMIPTVDLYKDVEHCFNIGYKWRLHKAGLFRGPVNFGRLENGHVDIQKSDTCELIDAAGNLVNSLKLSLSDLYTFHLGYLDLEDRVTRNREFWKANWSLEAGKEVEIPISVEELERDKKVRKHNLRFWNAK